MVSAMSVEVSEFFLLLEKREIRPITSSSAKIIINIVKSVVMCANIRKKIKKQALLP